MSWLFKIEGKLVSPNPETLLVEPFKQIWEDDKSKDKEVALKNFAYIEFMSSQLKSNPYKGYSSLVRSTKIIEDILGGDKKILSTFVDKGISYIDKIQKDGSESYTLLMSALKAKEKLEIFLNDFDLTERTEKGMPVMKPKDVTSALLDLDKIVVSINTLKKKVEEDLFEEVKTRANKIISPFADPSSIH